jgi:polysaccharide pyruvyl transferase WcaK-like protein
MLQVLRVLSNLISLNFDHANDRKGSLSGMVGHNFEISRNFACMSEIARHGATSSRIYVLEQLYRVYKKKLNRFEIALSFGKQLLASSFLCI